MNVELPRYYFHFTDGKQVLNNHKGITCPAMPAAREDAVALARDLKHGGGHAGLELAWLVRCHR
ncbi:MAG: hypothetical protein WCD54_28575, partial [Pseudolabrys sp.]